MFKRGKKNSLGQAFVDNVKEVRSKRQWPRFVLRGWGVRITSFYAILIIAFFVLLVRLFHLTVVKGDYNRKLSENNRIRNIVIHAPRGILYDRRNVPLVKNKAAFRYAGHCDEEFTCVPQLIIADEADSVVKSSVLAEQDFFREHTQGEKTAHVLGYLGEISYEELQNPHYSYQNYRLGDRIGKTGLEAVYESTLRGQDGKALVEVNADQTRLRVLGEIEPTPGKDIHLSLDSDLQAVAYDAINGKNGAVVASKPSTGEILALVSTPAFDPNALHRGITEKNFDNLLGDQARPLFNRAVSGAYPPGSTFKLVSAIAGLESGAIKPTTLIEDTGVLTVGEFSFGNWYYSQYGKVDGMVDIVKGIARSNDIFFYKLGERIGVETLAEWGRKFGLGKKTGIELYNEAEGVMPDSDWKKRVRGKDWYLGDTYHLAIGQGDLLTTPLQINQVTAAIAARGVMCPPTLLKPSGVGSQLSDKCKDLGVSKETLTTVIEGMRRACYRGDDVEYQGTGWPFFNFSVTKETFAQGQGSSEKRAVPVACKTGTSEYANEQDLTHAWFTAFAPLPGVEADNLPVASGEPEIAVTVLLEGGGEGSTDAGPVAKKILEEWFSR